MKIQLKSLSISLNQKRSLSHLSEELKKLFFSLEGWVDENSITIIGIMHSLTFPKSGELGASENVNKILLWQTNLTDYSFYLQSLRALGL